MPTNDELTNRFTYHPPYGDQPIAYDVLRRSALQFALLINTLCPDARETDIALMHVEAAVMFANAAIAREPRVDPIAPLDPTDPNSPPLIAYVEPDLSSPKGRYEAFKAQVVTDVETETNG